jgi:hypothetical protein
MLSERRYVGYGMEECRLWRPDAPFLHRKCFYFLVLGAQVNPAG